MRVANLHYFTENHRFCVFRNFSLSGLNYRVLSSIYQPMVGAFAIGLYTTLSQQLPSEVTGFSPLEQQRKLFFAMELEHNERGRRFLAEQASKLEAVGLLQTSRRFVAYNEDYIYEYQLAAPLAPLEFFENQHLILLLRDKVGKHMVLSLREELVAEEPDELRQSSNEDISVPFYEIFKLNTQVIDYELEQALYQTAAARQTTAAPDVTTKGFAYADIIMRFPRGSRNRDFVENIKFRPDQLAMINIVAKKYNLTLQETCRLLDEDDAFDEEGHLQMDALKYQANLLYRQGKKREEMQERHLQKLEETNGGLQNGPEVEHPVEMAFYLEVPALFHGQCDIHQYNMMLRNEPYTLVLKRFFSKGSVPDGVVDMFEKIDINYKLPEEVINVLIHFIQVERRSWAKSSIEAVASDLLGKQIASYEQAVSYVRDKAKYREQAAARAANGAKGPDGGYGADGGRIGGAAGSGGFNGANAAGKGRPTYGKPRGGAVQKPKIVMNTDGTKPQPLSDERREAIRQKARLLDGKLE